MTPAGDKTAAPATAEAPKWSGKTSVGADDIYRLYFHGPAFQVLESVQTEGERVLGKFNKNLPPFTKTGHGLLSTPILVELCFQTAGIWEVGKTGVLALPHSIESLTLYPQHANGEDIYAEVQPVRAEDGSVSFNARVIDSAGRLFLELQNYRTIQLPYSVEQHLVAPLQKLVEEQN